MRLGPTGNRDHVGNRQKNVTVRRLLLATAVLAAVTVAGCSAPLRSVSTARPKTGPAGPGAAGSTPGAAASTPGPGGSTAAGAVTTSPDAGRATTSPGGPATTAQAPTPVTGSGTVPIVAPPIVATTTTTRVPGAGPAQFQITSADSGQTVTLRVGDSVRLVLDDAGMQWTTVNQTAPGLLRPDPAPSPPPHGQLLIWTAVQKGTDTVSATGTAFCPAQIACPMYARLFQVTIQVS